MLGEFTSNHYVPGGDALEVEHDWRVGGEGGLLLEQHPQDGRGGGQDDLVCVIRVISSNLGIVNPLIDLIYLIKDNKMN